MIVVMFAAENFAKFLSEEWDLTTFVDFLTAQSMIIQVRCLNSS